MLMVLREISAKIPSFAIYLNITLQQHKSVMDSGIKTVNNKIKCLNVLTIFKN